MDLHQENQSHFNYPTFSYLNFRFSVREVVINDVLKEIYRKKKEKSVSAVQIPQVKRTTEVNN